VHHDHDVHGIILIMAMVVVMGVLVLVLVLVLVVMMVLAALQHGPLRQRTRRCIALQVLGRRELTATSHTANPAHT
jgi:uncharacterized membrane protein